MDKDSDMKPNPKETANVFNTGIARSLDKLKNLEYIVGKNGQKVPLKKKSRPKLYKAVYKIFWLPIFHNRNLLIYPRGRGALLRMGRNPVREGKTLGAYRQMCWIQLAPSARDPTPYDMGYSEPVAYQAKASPVLAFCQDSDPHLVASIYYYDTILSNEIIDLVLINTLIPINFCHFKGQMSILRYIKIKNFINRGADMGFVTAVLLTANYLQTALELKMCLRELAIVDDTLEALGVSKEYQRLPILGCQQPDMHCSIALPRLHFALSPVTWIKFHNQKPRHVNVPAHLALKCAPPGTLTQFASFKLKYLNCFIPDRLTNFVISSEKVIFNMFNELEHTPFFAKQIQQQIIQKYTPHNKMSNMIPVYYMENIHKYYQDVATLL
ncbi:hypothetical protein G5I_06698 [Acromyrmex echinatior]|uniref:Uncharacterized protein n=1 Tax=Acromyrmex echinatior TaxID=103372 RepID=F4WLR8_ACREC|nr:hypothetical protein G5I_06698 [Acromyrmex echinatior]